MNLPADIASQMWEAMQMLTAQERLEQMANSDFPHMKTDFRKKEHRAVYSQAFPSTMEDGSKQEVTAREAFLIMNEAVSGR